MFLRRCERRKNGKRHICWAPVQAVRVSLLGLADGRDRRVGMHSGL